MDRRSIRFIGIHQQLYKVRGIECIVVRSDQWRRQVCLPIDVWIIFGVRAEFLRVVNFQTSRLEPLQGGRRVGAAVLIRKPEDQPAGFLLPIAMDSSA